MMEFLALAIYLGGVRATLGEKGLVNAILWPLYLGEFLAKTSLRDQPR